MSFYIGNTKITITFLFCALLGFLIAFDRHYILYAFIMVCAHEGAHLLAMKMCALQVDAVILEPFGIIIRKCDTPAKLSRRLAVIGAGCTANVILTAVFFLLYTLYEKTIFFELSAVNGSIFIMNALPVLGLDGGQAVYEVLKWKKGERIALKTAKTVSFLTAGVLFVLGMIICFKIRFNPSICLLSLFLLIQTSLNRVKYD